MSKTSLLGLAALGALLLSGLPGCGSCVTEGDRLVVNVIAADDLNDTGSGPQSVRYRIWAVSESAQFDAATPESLAADDPGVHVSRALGNPFPASSAWLTPGLTTRLQLNVASDEQYTHIGIAALFPVGQKQLIALDCEKRSGYRKKGDDHVVDVRFLADNLSLGGAGEASE